MPDAPIVDSSTTAAPKDYKFSGSGSLLIKSVRASIDGSGAAGSYVPALQLLAPDGTVMFSAVCETNPAAGVSADVSWFPGGGLGGSGVGTGAAWFYASLLSNQSIPSTTARRIGWTHHVTSDPSVFTVTTHLVTDDTVNGLKDGIYIAMTDVHFDTGVAYARSCRIVTDFFNISSLISSPVSDSNTNSTPSGNITHTHDASILLTQAIPGEIMVIAENDDGVARNITFAYFAIVYLPNSTLVT